MATQRWTLEVRVGFWILLGLILAVIFIFAIGDLSTYFRPGYQLRVLFSSANGISKGAPVQYAGVEVGKIQAVEIVRLPNDPRPQVELVVRLPKTITVRQDDRASISTFGLLGEKYLGITPGPGKGEILGLDGQLVGETPVSMEHLIQRSDEVMMQLQQILGGINSLVGDAESRVYLREALQEARDATRQWRALGERLNLTLSSMESGKGTLGKFLYDDQLYDSAVLFVEELRANPWKLLARPKRSRE